MDSSMLFLIVVFILILVGMYFFNRNRVAPRGTYDDRDFRSGGSLGGGQRTYDDPDFRSSGTIGGTGESRGGRSSGSSGTRAYDDKDFKSGGSIGG